MPLPKPIDNVDGNLTKAQRSARERAEEIVFKPTKPKASELTKNHAAILKIFKRLMKTSDLFNDSDSDNLNALAYLLYHKSLNEQKLNEIALDDEQYERYFNRIEKANKQIKTLQDNLAMTTTQRLRVSNDLAKTFLEEEKLKAMKEPERKEVAPIFEVLQRNTGKGV